MQYLKTGVLFEFSCMTGARIALNRMEDPQIDIVQKFAKLAGTAFQIQDDIIGLVGEEEKVGKPIGSDIIEGKRTLIAVHGVTHANPEQKAILLNALGNANASTEEVKACLDVMKEIGSIQYAFEMARDMAKEAAELTDQLPKNDNSRLLKNFAAYMIERKF
jgi:geranylgeranyl diphosphate synthase type I